MRCAFCGGAVSWVGSLIDNPSTKCAGCGRSNCQEVEPLPDEVAETFCEYCGGNDETPQDHCMDCTRTAGAKENDRG